MFSDSTVPGARVEAISGLRVAMAVPLEYELASLRSAQLPGPLRDVLRHATSPARAGRWNWSSPGSVDTNVHETGELQPPACRILRKGPFEAAASE